MQRSETIKEILNTKPSVDPTLVEQQGGVTLLSKGESLTVDPNDIALEDKKTEVLKRIAKPHEIPISFEVKENLDSLLGLSKLLRQLHKGIFSQTEITSLLRPSKRNEADFEDTPVNKSILGEYLSEDDSYLKKYLKQLMLITALVEIIDDLEQSDQEFYSEVELHLLTWHEVLKELLPTLPNSAIHDSEKERLRKLLTGERIKGEYDSIEENNESDSAVLDDGEEIFRKIISIERTKEKRKDLKKRVRNSLFGSTHVSKRTEVANDFSNEFLRTSLVVNELRVINRLNKEGLDLKQMREDIKDIKSKYDQIDDSNKEEKTNKLNNELITYLIKIGNQINSSFPHVDSTFLSVVLAKSNAVCAGKVNALLVVCKYIGLEAVDCPISKTLDDKTGHTVCEISLLSGKKMIIDANYSSKQYLALKTDDELMEEAHKKFASNKLLSIDKTLEDLKRSKENAENIDVESNTLAYTFTLKEDEKHKYKFIRYNLNGYKITYFASIPHPHKEISPDKKGELVPSSVFFNFAHYLNTAYENYPKAIEYYQQALAANPNYRKKYINEQIILMYARSSDDPTELIMYIKSKLKENKSFVNLVSSLISRLPMKTENLKVRKKLLKICLEFYPFDRVANRKIAELYSYIGKPKLALNHYNLLDELNPKSVKANYGIAQIHFNNYFDLGLSKKEGYAIAKKHYKIAITNSRKNEDIITFKAKLDLLNYMSKN